MTLRHDEDREVRSDMTRTTTEGRRGIEWALGVVGAIALFLGLFITYGGEDQYLGIGGDWSWRVGDIDAAWAYGFLIGGAVLLVAAIALIWQEWRTRH